MAQKTVCDVCGTEIAEKDGPIGFEFRKARLALRAQFHDGKDWRKSDICRHCLVDAAKSSDDRPQLAPGPYIGSLQYFVTLNGIRCPGPHAAFHCEADAKKYVAAWGQGGEVKPA